MKTICSSWIIACRFLTELFFLISHQVLVWKVYKLVYIRTSWHEIFNISYNRLLIFFGWWHGQRRMCLSRRIFHKMWIDKSPLFIRCCFFWKVNHLTCTFLVKLNMSWLVSLWFVSGQLMISSWSDVNMNIFKF